VCGEKPRAEKVRELAETDAANAAVATILQP
jgi:hypothetical protein